MENCVLSTGGMNLYLGGSTLGSLLVNLEGDQEDGDGSKDTEDDDNSGLTLSKVSVAAALDELLGTLDEVGGFDGWHFEVSE
jgi:hypothetical protein